MLSETETVTADYKRAVVFAGDYLNKLTGEQIERECRLRLDEGCTELIVNFSRTEIVNSIGVSILLVRRVVFSVGLRFQVSGLRRHELLEVS